MSKKKAFQFFLSATCLAAAYFLSRFGLFSFHEMKQWPAVLAVTGIAVLAIAARFGCRIASATTVARYLGGFFLGFWLGKEGTDPGGGRTDSGWIIWTFIFLLGILCGFLADWIFQKKQKTGLIYKSSPVFCFLKRIFPPLCAVLKNSGRINPPWELTRSASLVGSHLPVHFPPSQLK